MATITSRSNGTETTKASKTAVLKGLSIEHDKATGLNMVCFREGSAYFAFGCGVSDKAAKTLRAEIRRDPAAYGII